MPVPVVWRELLHELDQHPADEATAVLARVAQATNPAGARDVDLVVHTLTVTLVVLEATNGKPQ